MGDDNSCLPELLHSIRRNNTSWTQTSEEEHSPPPPPPTPPPPHTHTHTHTHSLSLSLSSPLSLSFSICVVCSMAASFASPSKGDFPRRQARRLWAKRERRACPIARDRWEAEPWTLECQNLNSGDAEWALGMGQSVTELKIVMPWHPDSAGQAETDRYSQCMTVEIIRPCVYILI